MKIENIQILIVNDFAPMRRIIQNDLQIKNYKHFFSVANGLEAIQICKKEAIDLIITGWNMPVMSGLELIKQIRSVVETQHIPVLMITSETDSTQLNEAILAGVNDFIVKPFTPAVLYQKLDLIFSGQSPIIKTESTRSDAPIEEIPIPGITNKGETKILVVDDVSSNIDIIVGVLKDSYKIQAATNGKKALEIAATIPLPDLILLDIMMPEMDGMEVCRQLKNNPMTMDIPVIFLTAKTDAKTAVEGFSLGAVDYITKPVNPDLLKARVLNHIELKKSKDSLKNQVGTLMKMARLREDVERLSQQDIKKPLGFIINQLDSIQNNQLVDIQVRKLIKEVEISAVTILDSINNSLDLYKIETNNYQLIPEAVDIIKIISKVIDDCSLLFSAEINAKNLKIELKTTPDDNMVVKGDELLCYSLLSNLIKNAVEASDIDEKINISVVVQEQIIICVHYEAELPQQIQSSFFNKHIGHGKQQGIDVGGYAAKLMTEVQNGNIELNSSFEEGTRLIVKLPK
jgi:PleD family two-component response regulator